MKLTWTTILIFDVHFDVQFNGTPQMRDAVLILNHFVCANYTTKSPSGHMVTRAVNLRGGFTSSLFLFIKLLLLTCNAKVLLQTIT